MRYRLGQIGRVIGLLALVKLLCSLAIQRYPVPTPHALHFLLTGRWRQRYRQPAATLAPLAIQAGMHVLELGSGPGFFSPEAARQVGPHGSLVCVDVQRQMLQRLQRRVQTLNLANVFLHAATAEQLPLADASMDVVYAIAVLPMVADKPQALLEVQRVLRPGGMFAVSEDLVEPEYVPAWVTRRWCQRAGFVLVEQIRSPWCYMLIFRRGTRV